MAKNPIDCADFRWWAQAERKFEMGHNRKSSMRANVFRFALESGHCGMQSPCLFRANAQ